MRALVIKVSNRRHTKLQESNTFDHRGRVSTISCEDDFTSHLRDPLLFSESRRKNKCPKPKKMEKYL